MKKANKQKNKSWNFLKSRMSKESSCFIVYTKGFLLQFEQSNIYFNKI